MILLTLVGFVISFGLNSWKVVFNYPHAIVANPTVLFGILAACGGIYAKMSRDKSANPDHDWRSNEWLKVVKLHKTFGYTMVFASQITVSLGINCKWIDPGMIGMVWGAVICNLMFFFTILFTLEMRHRQILESLDAFAYSENKMTS